MAQQSTIIEQYLQRQRAHEQLATTLLETLETALADQRPAIHDLSWRIKTAESLATKISRPDAIYRRLDDVTDVIGLRIITYFEDSLEVIAATLEGLFRVDLEHSVDKRVNLNAEQFGYQSLHYVCRAPLSWRQRFGEPWLADVPFEVQLRTVLQHTWAEIEHDLGYKSQALIPRRIRRRFSRLAGLLEIADEEFVAIRRSLEQYEREVADRLHTPAGDLPLDLFSLRTLLRDELVRRLDHELAEQLGKPLGDKVFFPDYLLKMLGFHRIVTVGSLMQELEAHSRQIVEFVGPYFGFTREQWSFDARDMDLLPLGYCVLLLGHLKLITSHPLALGRIERAARFFQTLDYPADEETARRVATSFVDRFCR